MLALLTVTFSALKGIAIGAAAFNAAMLAALLVLLFITHRRPEKKKKAKPQTSYFLPPNK